MSRRARKVFRATVIEGFGGLIFLMLVGAALPRLVDTGNMTAQEKDMTQQVQSVKPAVYMQDLTLPANGSPQSGQQSAAKDSSTAIQPQGLLDRIGWEHKIRVQPHVYLTDRRQPVE